LFFPRFIKYSEAKGLEKDYSKAMSNVMLFDGILKTDTNKCMGQVITLDININIFTYCNSSKFMKFNL